MQKRQLIEGLSAELHGLIRTISVYRNVESRHFERETDQIKSLGEDALEMSEKDIRRGFQNLRVKFQMKYMLGLRALRCRIHSEGEHVTLSEFHTGEDVILTHPVNYKDMDELGYIRIKGDVIRILGDSTIVMKPDGVTD